MPTIHITPKTTNFSKLGNNLHATDMPELAHKVLCYLLSRPKDWQLRRSDLKKTLGLTGYKVQKALKILQNLGHAFFRRFKDGRTRWDIFEEPQPLIAHDETATPEISENVCSPVNTPDIDIPNVENKDDLIISINNNIKTTTLSEHESIENQSHNVVVIKEEEDVEQLQYPVQLKESQKRAAKNLIKKAPTAIRQDVLFALAYAITANRVNNPIAYLTALVNRANNGTFEPIITSKTPPTIEERLKAQATKQKRIESEQIDNLAHFKQLFKQFGDAVLHAIPEQYRKELMT